MVVLAINFQTIELKGKVDFNTSDEDVLKFLRERVEEAIATAENTLRARIDKFGVSTPKHSTFSFFWSYFN
jgi:SecD/SecF fusion protein